MIDISRSVGDNGDQRGTHCPAIRDQLPHQNACEVGSPRLAKRDRSYRPLPTNAALYLLALVTRGLTLSGTNERRQLRRLSADVGRTVPRSLLILAVAILLLVSRSLGN